MTTVNKNSLNTVENITIYTMTIQFSNRKETKIMSLTIQIKYFDTPDYKVERIQAIEKGDWIDLRASEDVFIPIAANPYNVTKDQTPIDNNVFIAKPTLVPLGVAMKLPDGYEAHTAPRSSTFKNWGVIQTNSIGIIDQSYCGDNDMWRWPVICLSPKDTYIDDNGNTHIGTWIHKGDRVCQFRIQEKMPQVTFEEVPHLSSPNRGGFGSTGKN